ncbi:unnamed protein product [Durusdinium trenchii]|uniref:Shootin-1 n=1 Tax=Durusdinium trenchii TaxID=1381693 RepID=A0ABP0T199_9DINO
MRRPRAGKLAGLESGQKHRCSTDEACQHHLGLTSLFYFGAALCSSGTSHFGRQTPQSLGEGVGRTSTQGGSGVSGVVLDQLREDLQALLRAKRQAYEARQQLDEKESKIASVRQDLRATKLSELEEDVQRAKAEAKVKAADLEAQGESNSYLVKSQTCQKEAKDLFQEMVETQNSVAAIHQQIAKLQDERVRFDQLAEEHQQQAESLKEKRLEIEEQKEQCEERLLGLANVEALHKEKTEVSARVRMRLAEVKEAVRAGEAVKKTLPDCRVDARLFQPGFQPEQAEKGWAWRLLDALQTETQAGAMPTTPVAPAAAPTPAAPVAAKAEATSAPVAQAVHAELPELPEAPPAPPEAPPEESPQSSPQSRRSSPQAPPPEAPPQSSAPSPHAPASPQRRGAASPAKSSGSYGDEEFDEDFEEESEVEE